MLVLRIWSVWAAVCVITARIALVYGFRKSFNSLVVELKFHLLIA